MRLSEHFSRTDIRAALVVGAVIGMTSLRVGAQDTGGTQLLLEQMEKDGVAQSDLEAAAPVMQEFAAGNLSEDEAQARLVGVADGRLVKYLSNNLFRHFFRRADPVDFFKSLRIRGIHTKSLEELHSSVNFYFRPQTESQAAQWEFATNTLFIPVEFCQEGTNKIRADLEPYEINTVIHELDHAEKDLQDDLLTFRGKSFGGKIYTGFSWGAVFALLGLIGTTFVGSLHWLKCVVPALGKLGRFKFLTSAHVSLGILVGATAIGFATGLVCYVFSSDQYSDQSTIEEENSRQIEKIRQIINADPSQMMKHKNATEAAIATTPIRTGDAMRLGLGGTLVGGALGLLLGSFGWGPKLLGKRKILRALSYPWALAVTCAAIGAISLGCVGAWQSNTFAKVKAWEISGYYSGECVQEVLEDMQDIAWHNTKQLDHLPHEDLEQLQEMDEQGQFKLLLPEQLLNMPADQADFRDNPLSQLTLDHPGAFKRFGRVNRGFRAYFVGEEIGFPYRDHPGIFESLFTTSMALRLDQLTRDQERGEYSSRGLANFMERSDLQYFQRLREGVRRARREKIQEL